MTVQLSTLCPKCNSPLVYREGEDEYNSNELHWYAINECTKCEYLIQDYDNDFQFPDDGSYPVINGGVIQIDKNETIKFTGSGTAHFEVKTTSIKKTKEQNESSPRTL